MPPQRVYTPDRLSRITPLARGAEEGRGGTEKADLGF